MKAVLFLVLCLAAVAYAANVFPNTDCDGAPTSTNVELASPVFVESGSTLDSSTLVLNYQADNRFSSIAFQFTTGSSPAYCSWDSSVTGSAVWAASNAGDLSGNCGQPVLFQSTFTAPLTALGDCFTYDNTTDSNYVYYTATVKITTTQNRVAIRNTAIVRTVTTAVQLRFQFQRFITVNSSAITVVGNANILSDIISQTFSTSTLQTTVVALTSVQQPYMMKLGHDATTNNNADVTPTTDYTTTAMSEIFAGNNGQNGANAGAGQCTAGGVNNAGSITSAGSSSPTACTQKWQVTIAATDSNTCLFTPTLKLTWLLDVAPDYLGSSAGISSLNGGTTYAITYPLAANDFCSKVVTTITLSGTLTPYGAAIADPTNPGTALYNYLYGQPVYFLAFVQTNTGPSITGTHFVSANVLSVSTINSFSIPLTQSLGPGNIYQFAQFEYPGTYTQYAGFTFMIDQNSVQLDDYDVAQTVSVSAIFLVDYQNLGSVGVELASAPHFRTMASGTQNMAMNVDMAVTRPSTASGSSSLVAMVAGIAAGCVALTAIVALFLYRRSTNKFEQQVSTPIDPKELEAIEARLASTTTAV
jgi:hypothetical protein